MDSLKLVKCVLILICMFKCTTAQSYAEACFSIEVSYRLIRGSFVYHYQVTNSTGIATISCPTNTYISMNGSFDYVVEDTHTIQCYEHSKTCTESSPCDCCKAPHNNTGLCFSEHGLAEDIATQCNSGKTTCQINIPPLKVSIAEVGSCSHLSDLKIYNYDYAVGGKFGRILSGKVNSIWPYARWARVYYECLQSITGSADGSNNKATTTSIVAGVVGGAVILIIVVIIVTVCVCRRKKSEKPLAMQNMTTNVNNNVYNDNDSAVLDVYDTPNNPHAHTNTVNCYNPRADTNIDAVPQNNSTAPAATEQAVYAAVDKSTKKKNNKPKPNGGKGAGLINKNNTPQSTDMEENTYYESQDVKQANQPIDNEMTENTYYESEAAGNSNETGYYSKEQIVSPDENQFHPTDENDTGNYAYTYGHFELERRKRDPKLKGQK